ncbi:MAG: DUF92 domain-containing protein [candidate division Zixibacteria bacterium]|nr:DUF92 domain-containing protein [candidate division Zixibacteria bacterium]
MTELSAMYIIIGGAIAAVLAVPAWRFGALTKSGAVGMVIIGTIAFGLGGIVSAIPLVYFFISSSLLSKMKTAAKTAALDTVGKTGPRDLIQVFANGGVGALCLLAGLFTTDHIWFYGYLASISEACADTWATEIGTLAKHRPVSIVTCRQVAPGQSGGVSTLGTLAAFAGAITTVATAYAGMAAINPTYHGNPSIYIIVVIAGFIGSLVDSILGATVQAQYRCSITGKITEKIESGGQPNPLIRGFRWIGNDVVNTAGTLIAALIALLFLI